MLLIKYRADIKPPVVLEPRRLPYLIEIRVTESLDPILFRDCVEDDRLPFLCERFAKSFVNNGESRNCALLFSAGESVNTFFLCKHILFIH